MAGSSEAVDVELTNALVVDGTGAQPYLGSVGVRGDTIASVIPVGTPTPAAVTTVDCTGLVVTPGFVDIHTHSDVSFLLDPLASSKVAQGVTTEVVGNCGFSPFPVAPARGELLAEFLCGLGVPRMDVTWSDFDGYAKALDAAEPVMNVAALVGHGALRIAAHGNDDVLVDAGLTGDMAVLLAEQLDQGAFGLSTGLTYVPSRFAAEAEIHALAGVVERHDALYATHSRATGGHAMYDEAIEVGRRTGARVQFSHLALNDPRTWGSAGAVLTRFAAARDEGVDIRYDVYPYAASASSLTQYLPAWLQEYGEDGIRRMLADPGTYEGARSELARGLYGLIPWDWQRVVVALVGPGDDHLAGASVGEVAARDGVSGEQVCLDLCARYGNAVQVVLFYRHEDDVAEFVAHPLGMIGSDGNALSISASGRPHPRSFGTHARLLQRYVAEKGVLSLAEAVHKATLAPAQRLGLRRRGRLAAGWLADLAAFAVSEVRERATWTDPCQLAHGVRHVWVNGTRVLADGQLTGTRPGRVLRHGID